MDLQKAGALIRKLRLEKQMTQRQLAEKMGVAPKTISKWECAQGFPDVSLLPDLSDALGTDMTSLLSGQRNEKEKDGGNEKNRFASARVRQHLTATGGAKPPAAAESSAMKAWARNARASSRRWTANGM
ncbi:MAG: helix-turn-helix domain-containing protein [Christensenellales bacterium]